MADCDNDQECEKIVPTPIKPEPLPKQCSGGGESGEGTNDFNELDNRPKYDGRRMTGDTNIPAYSDFTGTDGQTAGTAGLVPAPATADADKFLKSDGTWAEAGGGSDINVVQTTGTSQTDVMSQKATSEMVYAGGSLGKVQIGSGASASAGGNSSCIAIGTSSSATGTNNTALGVSATASGGYSLAVGLNSTASANNTVALGRMATASGANSVAIGWNAKATQQGQFDISTGTNQTAGYNDSGYRLLTGLYDGQNDHDAATVGQLHYRQRKPNVVWEVDGEVVTTGLVAVGEDISANPNWQLTGLDLTPYKRIKIFTKAAQKAGTTASASTTPAMVLEMSLDDRAAIAEYGGNFVGSMIAQKPNDANRLCTLTCAVSADKTKFEVLRMTNLYGTAATSNSDVNAYVFKIEGYYD